METSIRKLGNSAGLLLPASLLKSLHLTIGQTVDLLELEGRLVVTPMPRKHYALKDLLAKCDAKAAPPADMAAWNAMAGVGAGGRVSTVFDRGDIVRVCLNPVVGRELQGDLRPALVLSSKAFNRLGVAFVAPITQGGDFSRYAGFAVTLMGAGTKTQGVALVNMVRSLDLTARGATLVERVPAVVLDDAMARLRAILDD